jgi:hypothetical protein
MADEGAGKVHDTTLRRIAGGAGFNARVEPFWNTFGKVESRLGFFERRRERGRLERILKSIRRQIVSQKGDPGDWSDRTGECICNLRVAKMGLVRELKTWLKTGSEGDASAKWPHLNVLRDRPCMIIPVPFAAPVSAEPGGDEEPIPVASAERLKAELAEVNAEFRIDETFAIKKMVDYMDATDRDIALYEKRLGTSEGFWAKFSYVLLKKLADVSVEKRLPVFFA